MDRDDALNENFNQLRNAAFGRGAVPLVPAAVAATVQATVDAWRVRRAAAIAAPWPTEEYGQWSGRANALREAISNAGGTPPAAFTPPASLLERVEHVAALTGEGLAIVAVLALALSFAWRRRAP
jgi:hypothetical protein